MDGVGNFIQALLDQVHENPKVLGLEILAFLSLLSWEAKTDVMSLSFFPLVFLICSSVKTLSNAIGKEDVIPRYGKLNLGENGLDHSRDSF